MPVTAAQRNAALVQAERAKASRLTVRAMLRTEERGTEILADMLADGDEVILHWRAYQLLLSVRKMGEYRVRSMLRRHDIYPIRRVAELTQRQRNLLADELRDHARAPRQSERTAC